MKQVHNKLYVITRADISAGYQSVQAGHAAIQFQYDHPKVAADWFKNSQYLAFLSAKNQEHLLDIVTKAESKGVKVSVFREPDIGDEITSIALEPGDASSRLCSNLPLMLKNK